MKILINPYHNNPTQKNQKTNFIQEKNKTFNPSFKQLTPEHFFINIPGYQKHSKWGEFVSKLANNSKNTILNLTLKNSLYEMAKKYHKFEYKEKELSLLKFFYKDKKYLRKYFFNYGFGIKKKSYHSDIWAIINESPTYKNYYPKCKELLENQNNKFNLRKTNLLFYLKKTKFLTYQAQEGIDNKKLILTQIGYKFSNDNTLNTEKVCLIHPPAKTGNKLLAKAQEYLDELKIYKNVEIKEEKLDKIYQKIGSIHWCLAQGMPFLRGSASLSIIYTKSLFEALNIQTGFWKKGIAPDWESFITPLDEFSKKYRSFFEP